MDRRPTAPRLLGAARPQAGPATYNNTTANSIHQIRIEFYNGGGPGQLHVNWVTPTGTYQQIPGQYLRPRYGLTTSTFVSESHGVPNQVTTTRYAEDGLDAVYGLPTSTTVGSGGLQLSTRTGFESPGAGYLRQTSKTMPSGAVTTYAQYGDTETRANPCTPGSPAVNQGGMPQRTTAASPVAGPTRVEEKVYDASGRVVAEATAGDWTCTTYDSRDRVVSRTYPATPAAPARTETRNYAVGGDPLTTSVGDERGTVTTQLDLVGRVVAYTDVHGVRTETTYDRVGRAVTVTLDPPGAVDPAQVTTYTYDDAGRALTTTLDGTLLATATYNSAGELATVTYANGSALAAVERDESGRETSLTWTTSDNAQVTSAVTRSRTGTVVDETLAGADARPNAPNYLYDSAGRLAQAWVTGHHYTYDYTSAASATCPTGSKVNAGANSNRVRLLDATPAGTAETGYCYDAADRIIATTGANSISDIQYDDHGNTTRWTAGPATTTLGWDGADRNLTAYTSGPDPASVTYARDATDRLIRRDASTGDTVATVLYGYTADGDTADLTLNSGKRIASRTLSLPGNVLYTITGGDNPQPPTWDHPTLRGNLTLTTDTNGHQLGELRTYTPYGEPITATGAIDPDNVPDNQPGHMDYGWLGQHQRAYEHAGTLSLIQMGARPYSPALGRFLSVDPIDGGSANDYDYTNADPINATDLDGEWPQWLKNVGKKIRNKVKKVSRWLNEAHKNINRFVKRHWRTALKVGITVGAAAAGVACAASIVCGVVVGGAAAGGIYAAHNAGTRNWRWKDFAGAVGIGMIGGFSTKFFRGKGDRFPWRRKAR